ncbi:hypothetical protein C8R43DRAFT_1131575 [Mycena crocata]|nr:hypothetical protein C8R43DRAFT_1131575 [Mycena crocata]
MLNGSLHTFYGGPSTYFDASRSPSFDPIALGLTRTVDLYAEFYGSAQFIERLDSDLRPPMCVPLLQIDLA